MSWRSVQANAKPWTSLPTSRLVTYLDRDLEVLGTLKHLESSVGIGSCNLKYTILGYIISRRTERMAHTTKDKARLLSRVRRIRGQVEAIERALDGEHECSSVLQLMAACRGALNGLMAEVLEGHIRFHVLDSKSGKNAPQVEAAEELIGVVRTYLK